MPLARLAQRAKFLSADRRIELRSSPWELCFRQGRLGVSWSVVIGFGGIPETDGAGTEQTPQTTTIQSALRVDTRSDASSIDVG
jgi:hypothetical protein